MSYIMDFFLKPTVDRWCSNKICTTNKTFWNSKLFFIKERVNFIVAAIMKI